MPRRRRRSSSQSIFSPGQAKYVLERLISDRRISSADVRRYADDMKREIGDLERRLESLREATSEALRGAVRAMTPGRRRGRPPASAKAGAKRRRRPITAQQRASRVLQGRYLGLIRQIPAARRSVYQKIAKDKGREAAIREMRSALSK